MQYWYDTRKGDINRFPIYGWIFPCFFCCQPTVKDKIIRKHKIYKFINIPCCDLCKNKQFKLNDIDSYYILDERQKILNEKREIQRSKYRELENNRWKKGKRY
jgi:hypothetical protein